MFCGIKKNIFYLLTDPANFPNLGPDDEPEVAAPVLTEETKSLRSAYRQNLGETFTLVNFQLKLIFPKCFGISLKGNSIAEHVLA